MSRRSSVATMTLAITNRRFTWGAAEAKGGGQTWGPGPRGAAAYMEQQERELQGSATTAKRLETLLQVRGDRCKVFVVAVLL